MAFMKINLQKLASELARMDGKAGRNEDIISAQTMLASLGMLLRMMPTHEAMATIAAIVDRSGRRVKK